MSLIDCDTREPHRSRQVQRWNIIIAAWQRSYDPDIYNYSWTEFNVIRRSKFWMPLNHITRIIIHNNTYFTSTHHVYNHLFDVTFDTLHYKGDRSFTTITQSIFTVQIYLWIINIHEANSIFGQPHWILVIFLWLCCVLIDTLKGRLRCLPQLSQFRHGFSALILPRFQRLDPI